MWKNYPNKGSASKRALVMGLSLLLMFGIWHRNFNLLGAFYDYSILPSAVGHLREGLFSYRDFTTPLQSLTIWLCYLAELFFGSRYLAMAYANLVVGLAGYFLLLKSLKPGLSFYSRALVATTFCLCTFFQHGILWYNSVAMLLLSLICLEAVKFFHDKAITAEKVAGISMLIFLSSMNKINFHALGMMIIFSFLTARTVIHRNGAKTFFKICLVWCIAGAILGPVAETLVNHTTPHVFLQNISMASASRGKALFNFLNPYLYLGKIQDFYPDNWTSGAYLIGFLVFAAGLRVLWLSKENSDSTDERLSLFFKISVCAGLAIVYFASLLLTITNMETEVLTASFLLIGLVAVFLAAVPWISESQRLVFKSLIFILAAYFAITGCTSAFMHSRIRYWEDSWASTMMESFHKQRKLSALKTAVPFYRAEDISPDLMPYFGGVEFTKPGELQLVRAVKFVADTHPTKNFQDIYWGPGLEILNRVYPGHFRGKFPLWYHYDVTAREKDSPRIITEFQREKFEWIVSAGTMKNMPEGVLDYISKAYDCTERDEIIVYHLRH